MSYVLSDQAPFRQSSTFHNILSLPVHPHSPPPLPLHRHHPSSSSSNVLERRSYFFLFSFLLPPSSLPIIYLLFDSHYSYPAPSWSISGEIDISSQPFGINARAAITVIGTLTLISVRRFPETSKVRLF